MNNHGSKPPLSPDDLSDVLHEFIGMRETPAVATVDELVRVKVGKDLTVRSVEILDPRLDHAFRDRLQTAIAGAVNTALQRAVREVAQTIHDISEQKRAEGK